MLQQVVVYVDNAELQRCNFINLPTRHESKMNEQETVDFVLVLNTQYCMCVHVRYVCPLLIIEQAGQATTLLKILEKLALVCGCVFCILNNRSEAF